MTTTLSHSLPLSHTYLFSRHFLETLTFSPNRNPFQSPHLTIITRASTSNEDREIRVCTNRTCRRQGSMQTLDTLSGIAPPNVVVKPCGCLGRCGSGPNIVALPGPLLVSHCGTPSKAANFMFRTSDTTTDGSKEADGEEVIRKCLQALAWRKRAETELDKGNFEEAELLFSQVVDLKPFGGLHFAYRGRSTVKFKMGNFQGALADAEEALIMAPNYVDAYICQGDALLAMDKFEAAEVSYSMALDKDPCIRRSKSFKDRVLKLQEKLASISRN